MELRNRVEIKVKAENNECSFFCNQDAPLGFLFDSLCQMREFVLKRMEEEAEKDKKKEKCCEKDEPRQEESCKGDA